MTARFGLSLTAAMLLCSPALAQTVIVQDDFESYADTNAFLQTWVPTNGTGTTALATTDPSYLAGVLTTDPFSNPANFPGVQGTAVDHVGAFHSTTNPMVNQFGGVTPAFTINPTPTQDILLSADIFVGPSGNERMSVGLRSKSPANLIEMGYYNTNTRDPRIAGPSQPTPTDPNFLPSKGFAYRLVLFGARAPDLLVEPNWQYFDLPIELDRVDDTDDLVTLGDIGQGWHTYTALITPTTVTFKLDLFRDGKRNTTRDIDGNIEVGVGADGVDAEVTWEISTTAAGYDSLRIGGPSGLSSAGAGAMGFDNILLQTQASAAPADDADFDNDGDVDGADFLIWQKGLITDGSASNASGDANDDGDVDGDDLAIWKTEFGQPQSVANVGAVPEPASLALGAIAMVAGLAVARRRK